MGSAIGNVVGTGTWERWFFFRCCSHRQVARALHALSTHRTGPPPVNTPELYAARTHVGAVCKPRSMRRVTGARLDFGEGYVETRLQRGRRRCRSASTEECTRRLLYEFQLGHKEERAGRKRGRENFHEEAGGLCLSFSSFFFPFVTLFRNSVEVASTSFCRVFLPASLGR